MPDLKGKLALVSGGARDIGQAVVLDLARHGADVHFTHANTPPDNSLAALQKLELSATPHKLDCLNYQQITSLITSLPRPIDILVNVTGGLVARKKIDEMDEGFWDQVIDLNLKSTFLLTKAALTKFNDHGAIVNFSSQAGRDGGGPGALAYATAKGALMTFTRGLAKELAPRKIRANAVCPGMINTTFHDTFTKPEVRQRVASMTPLGREGTAQEVAALVTFLASNDSSFINAANIDINGGIFYS